MNYRDDRTHAYLATDRVSVYPAGAKMSTNEKTHRGVFLIWLYEQWKRQKKTRDPFYKHGYGHWTVDTI